MPQPRDSWGTRLFPGGSIRVTPIAGKPRLKVHFTHPALVLLRPGLRLPAALRECSACPEPPLLEIHQLLLQKQQKCLLFMCYTRLGAVLGERRQERRIRGSVPSDVRGLKLKQSCPWLLLTCFGKSSSPIIPSEKSPSKHRWEGDTSLSTLRKTNPPPKTQFKKIQGFSSCQSFPWTANAPSN